MGQNIGHKLFRARFFDTNCPCFQKAQYVKDQGDGIGKYRIPTVIILFFTSLTHGYTIRLL